VKEIREWLEKGQDYAQGVALYETHGKSRVVLNALRFGATEFTRQKLKAELGKLLVQENVRVVDTLPKRVHEKPKRVPIEPKVDSSLKKVDSSPAVHEQRRAWFAERNHLHPQLELVATDTERLAMSLRILELADLISQSYKLEAAPVAVHLATPGLATLEHEGEIRRLLANLRPQRTKLKKRSDRALDLAQVELDILILEEKLKKRDGGESQLQ
jgi:hypothetical protein